VFGNETWWPFLLGFTALFSVFQLATLPFCPESPRFLLINKNDESSAQKALSTLRESEGPATKLELEELRQEATRERNLEKFSFTQLFTTRSLLFPTIISVVLHLSQQLSGINAVFFYSNTILTNAGVENPTTVAPFVGLILVIMTLISIPLMEKSGRRFLHLLGLSGMFVFSILMTVAFVFQETYSELRWLAIVSMLLYVLFFAIGPGSIPWLMVAEMYSQAPRSAAVSLAVCVNWSANFVLGLGFPPMFENVTKNYTFLLFTFLLAFFIAFIYAFLPETKNKKVEEITAYFGDKRNLFYFRRNKHQENLNAEF
jgi:SP family facilitated glucose transporter-like MFS transporter 1